MAKTYEQARKEALDAGIPESDLKPEVIAQFGHDFADPSAGFTPNEPKLSSEQLKQHLAFLDAEGKANRMPVQIFNVVKKIAATVAPLLLALMFLVASGCSSQRASETAGEISAAAQQLDQDHTALEETLIAELRDRDLKQADKLYEDAVKSVTRTVKTTQQTPIKVRTVAADGTTKETTEYQTVEVDTPVVNPDTLKALMNKKLEHYAQIEANVKSIRGKMATISRNRANIEALTDGLRKYFNERADAYEAANDATDLALQYLDKFVNKKPRAETANAGE
ncbi:MAG: hypothetical protein KIS92_04475 [Planctomycetota bacterium]|nr:hypothetical protein [Planctomycetota bacterium]